MRKASKATIKTSLADFRVWKLKVLRRAIKTSVPGAPLEISNHLRNVERDIADGMIGICTNSYLANIANMVKCCESGYYREALPGGGWRTI